jgi:hypothetical protein
MIPVLARVLMLMAILATTVKAQQIDMMLQVDFGQDDGRNLGTVFELRAPITGETICAAGFATYSQTRTIASSRWLEFFCRANDPLKVTDLGRIADDVYRPVLVSLPGRLLETTKGYVSTDGGATWTRDPSVIGVFSGQTVGRGALLFRRDGLNTVVQFDGAELFREHKAARSGLFYRGRIAVAYDDNTIVVCEWRPGTGCESKRSLAHEPVSDFYAALGFGDAVYFVGGPSEPLNGKGHQIFRLLGDRIEKVYESDHIYGQIYSAVVWRDRMLTGEFPDGYVYEFSPETGRVVDLQRPPGPDVRLHFPAELYPSNTDYWLDRYREAQSLALYAGRVYVGMFPWAQLFSSRDLRTWDVTRLAQAPDIDDDAGWPYRRRLEERIRPMIAAGGLQKGAPRAMPSFWAQRITAIVPTQDGIVAAVGNRSGGAYDPEGRDSVMARADIDQYGRVFRIRAPASIMMPFDWPAHGKVSMRFEITADGLAMSIDGKLVARSVAGISPETLRNFEIVYGEGIFGRATVAVNR